MYALLFKTINWALNTASVQGLAFIPRRGHTLGLPHKTKNGRQHNSRRSKARDATFLSLQAVLISLTKNQKITPPTKKAQKLRDHKVTAHHPSLRGELAPRCGTKDAPFFFHSSSFFFPRRTLEHRPISACWPGPVPTEARSECWVPPVSQNAPQQPPSLMKYGQRRTRWAQGEPADLMSQFLR